MTCFVRVELCGACQLIASSDMPTANVAEVYRADVRSKGRLLSASEREKIASKYLPKPCEPSRERVTPTKSTGVKCRKRTRRKLIRSLLRSQLHVLLFFLIHLVFGIYIRIRQIYHATVNRILAILYYHHRTPELIRKDVKRLSRLPEHLSVILTLKAEEEGGLEALMDEVAELCAWCASAGIPLLSVYERTGNGACPVLRYPALRSNIPNTGILKSYIPSMHDLVHQKLSSYFGPPPLTPHLHVSAPNHPSHSPTPNPSPNLKAESTDDEAGNGHSWTLDTPERSKLYLLLISSTDGRDTLVDLTRTLTEMSQSRKLYPKDITSELINTEICATTSVPEYHSHPAAPIGLYGGVPTPSRFHSGEPDLLIIFSPYVKLDGYPPWQVRLTEIFCVGDSDGDISGRRSTRTEYQAFLRALWRFAGADMKFGR